MVDGDYSPIPPGQFGENEDRTFYQFGPPSQGSGSQYKAEFASMTKNIEFHLMSEYISPHTGLEREWTVAAETEPFQEGPSITWFSIELLAPLLDQGISVAERMLCHFRVAVTLLHEFTYSMRYGRKRSRVAMHQEWTSLTLANENARRKHILQINRIMAAWKDPPALSATLPIPSPPISDDDAGFFYKPRRDEIRSFLLNNREILAFGTMHFQMGEHVLLSHIRRVGGNLNLKYSELRAFLLDTSNNSRYFSITLIMDRPMPRQALVTRINPGWNDAFLPPAIPRPGYTTPAPGLLQWFDTCTDYVMNPQEQDYFNSPDQFDYDIDEFRRLAILAGKDIQDPPPYMLTRRQFRDCICEYESRNVRWALGPPGIIRKLITGWPTNVAVAGQKRKADVMSSGKKCRKVSKKRRKNGP